MKYRKRRRRSSYGRRKSNEVIVLSDTEQENTEETENANDNKNENDENKDDTRTEVDAVNKDPVHAPLNDDSCGTSADQMDSSTVHPDSETADPEHPIPGPLAIVDLQSASGDSNASLTPAKSSDDSSDRYDKSRFSEFSFQK